MEVVRSSLGSPRLQATAARRLLNATPTSTWPDDVLQLALGIQDTFETVTVVDHPGDNAWEQQYKDGVGPVTHTEQRIVDNHGLLRLAASEELDRRKG